MKTTSIKIAAGFVGASVCAIALAMGVNAQDAKKKDMPAMDHSKMMDHGKMDHSKKMDQGKMDHSKMGAANASDSPSTKAFREANARMHMDMDIQFSGNADVDFIKGMLPHHQGAVDMAKIVLEHGKDPAVKKLADEIIKAQNTEIAFMKEWLAKNAK